ncbi:MAG: PIG-L family deacetylase [Candidatus Pacebacteria bacterium]|nr:PIG-L family deacetylase [Candidatus Paceibacterota bacterium]
MMKLYSSVFWIVFVKAKISPHLIFLTAGELGIPQKSVITPMEMANIRKLEAQNAVKFLKASLTILSFPDLHLPFIPIEDLVKAVMPIIRRKKTDAIFSFDPYETTTKFDHPDHNIAGVVAKYVGAAADVKNFMPEHKVLKQRPELYLWSSKQKPKNIMVKQTKKLKEQRSQYLLTHYPSQFRKTEQKDWEKIFSKISENYEKVR